MVQQTAVNFLYEFVQLKLTHKQQMQFEGLFQQAKQMEKEQIVEAFYEGMKTNPFDPNRGRGAMYYNETYKTK
jgi:hypothetical protein